jgi:Glucose / Sorbosone dehydrogenase
MEQDGKMDKLEINRYGMDIANPKPQPNLLARLGMAYGLFAMAASAQQLTLEIKDYATLPITGSPEKVTDNVASLLARINFLREEPGGGNRFFVNDLNGPLYIVDRGTKKVTTYLDFNGREGHGGLFHKFRFENGQGNGLLNFFFDPDYVRNGKFYTIHLEDPSLPGGFMPDNTNFRGLKLEGYAITPAIVTPPSHRSEGVIIEWTDTNTSNSTFEGTAREVLRLQLITYSHPLGEMTFNPAARPGDPDWRVMYVACGDSASGEQHDPILRLSPQRLDMLIGKIWRIIPDPNEHTNSSTLSENGGYRIPNDNPFVNVKGARKEIWAYGLRNPTRLTWYVDPADRSKVTLIANVIGLQTWETVDLIHKGANYGYSLREGSELLKPDNTTGPLPNDDHIPIQITETATDGMVSPTYPVIQYGHVKGGCDAMSSGYVYQGKALPLLQGKYIFGDITTGNIWYTDFKDMVAADDGDPKTMAPLHAVKILWDKPASKELYGSMAPVTATAYHARGGKAETLPGRARVAGGRSDIHFLIDGAGELYILSKSDGVIRAVVGATMN